jgi:hypothetical protein
VAVAHPRWFLGWMLVPASLCPFSRRPGDTPDTAAPTDGSQRVGIQFHIKADPTPKGISAGRDDELQAAIKYLDAL